MRRWSVFLVLPLFLGACAATPVVDDATFIVPEEPVVDDFADLYSFHVRELVREDVAFGEILTRLGTTVSNSPPGGQMLLGEEALARAISDVSRVREGHREVLGFWEQVIAQWPKVSTIEDRADLALLAEIPARPR